MWRCLLGLVALAVMAACAAPPRPADMVFWGGAVHAMDAARTVAEAVAIRDGVIIYVGARKGAALLVGPATRIVDMAGGALFPGFTDAHVHMSDGGAQLAMLSLGQATTPQQVQALLAAYAKAHPMLDVIVGAGWELSIFPNAHPSKDLIDAVVPDRPVVLYAADGHNAWVNSTALARAGIDKATPDPANGRIEREATTGAPTGVLREAAQALLAPLIPKPSLDEQVAYLRQGMAYENAYGYTAAIEASVPAGLIEEAYAAAAKAGVLSLRIALSLTPGEALLDTAVRRETMAAAVAALAARRQAIAAQGFAYLTAPAVKIFVDGVMENHTAALLAPYIGSMLGMAHRGDLMMPEAVLKDYVTALDAAGFQVHFHAIGDRAVRVALDAVEQARMVNDGGARRHHLSHLELIDPADLPRFAALGAYANVQALWAYADGYITDLTEPYLGPARARWLYPIGSLERAGARLAMGSDWPVSSANPLAAIEVAVRRQDWRKDGDDAWHPEERASLDAMLAALTIGGARLMGEEALRGTLEAGKAADLTLLDRDPYKVRVEALSEIAARMTVLAGKPVYERP
ncbi:MAG: amidohydrolase [Pseudomonadota bacterium]